MQNKKTLRAVAIVVVSIICLALILTAIAMLVQYSDEVAEQAASKALYNTKSSKEYVDDSLDRCRTNAAVVASNVAKFETQAELYDYLLYIRKEAGCYDVLFVRFFKDGELFAFTGDKYDGYDISREYHEMGLEEPTYIGTFEDVSSVDNMSVIAFYCPVENSPLADAVVVYYTRNKAESFFPKSVRNENAEFSALCTDKGEVLAGREDINGSQILTVLRGMVGNKDDIDKVETILNNKTVGTVPVKIGGEDYIVSVCADTERMRDICVVELYNVKKLAASSLDFINTVVIIFVLFIVIAFIVIIYLLVHRSRMKKQVFNLETSNDKLSCLNRHGFEQAAAGILERNKNSNFYIIVVQLRHYKFIHDTYGEAELDSLLSYLRVCCSKTTQLEEEYGHIAEGQFLLLLHAKDRTALIERLKTHAFLATHYKGANRFDVMLKYGIYEVDPADNVSATQMIDFANEANNAIVKATEENATMQFNFYSNELRKIRLINEDMELRMEGALQNGEFQVFYQPKFSLAQGRQDGAEALVRWYDPKTNEYNRPALFMPLFETNGFIVKLDKYVYTKVCEYISYSIAHGRTVYPVSVNVSRITAVQSDFIDFYTRTKRKYGISDGLLMIEFTESFAYENYETLSEIVDKLHKNGFKCSIDDFGSGYSSYRILKFLPMDEIKLDRFFVEKGISDDRDTTISESIIGIGKGLGMKVTQEGVETYEDVQRLRALGCDVIQGYLYSHPLPLNDYITFVANSREHNIK